ncbi:MAG: cupin domain-containing protein [Candidatus Hodarchaeota archaeon]
MNPDNDYKFHMKEKYGHLQLIDIPEIINSCQNKWFNQTLCHINDCVIRLGIIEGEFHWHKHDKEDEFFFVIDGCLFIDLEEETIKILPKQGYAVPKGVLHRTRAKEKTIILMVEKDTVQPAGD